MPLDVKKLQCHVLSGTGRKFLRGPRGTGFLYVKADFIEQLDPPFVDLHSAEWSRDDGFEFVAGAKRFENWESFYAGRVGLMHAVRYANNLGLEAIEERTSSLAARLREALTSIKGVTVTDLGQKRCGIVTFTKDSINAYDLTAKLREQRINISASTFGSARLDFSRRKLNDLTRASVHYFNNDEEIERFVTAVDKA